MAPAKKPAAPKAATPKKAAPAKTASATATFTKADTDGTASFDTAWLSTNGWSSADGGLTYAKAGTYGTATLTLATGEWVALMDHDDVLPEHALYEVALFHQFRHRGHEVRYVHCDGRFGECDLYWVMTPILRSPELTQLDSAKSMMRNLPPK